MNNYLIELDKALKNVDAQTRNEIIADYREHFEIGLTAGKSEEQIIESLGNPYEIAKMYVALGAAEKAHKTKSPKDIFIMIMAIVSYKIVGGIFIAVLYFSAVSIMITLFAAAAGVIAAGLGAAAYAVYMFTMSQTVYAVLAVFTFIVFVSGGLLFFKGCIKLWKLTVGNLSYAARKIMRSRITMGETV